MFSFFGLFKKRGNDDAQPASTQTLPAADWLIVGLGNPGAKYAATRHNVGFMALDEFDATLSPAPGIKAQIGEFGDALLVKPTTFMNLSGQAVGALAQKLGIPPERVVVIHDELDLPPGTVKVKLGGNENGHNGLKSISQELGTRDYVRIRIGIARPPQGMRVPDYVLGPIEEDVSQALIDASDAAHLVITEGLSKAQNVIHGRRK